MNNRYRALRLVARINQEYWASRLKNPIILIGCPRSGTTLLSRVFDLHRDVADWSEANDVWDPTGHPWRLSKKKTLPVWVEPAEFTARWWEDARPRQQEIRAIFGLYQWLTGKPYFSNKTPYNTLRVEQVLQVIPDARLINIIRDGRAVVASYVKREVSKMQANPEYDAYPAIPRGRDEIALTLAKFWKFNVDAVHDADAKLKLTERGVLIDLRYEDLCEDIAGSLEKISAHTGLPRDRFDSAVKSLAEPGRNNSWRDQFSPSLADSITTVMQPTLSTLGYD